MPATKLRINNLKSSNDLDVLEKELVKVEEASKIIIRAMRAPIYISSDYDKILMLLSKGAILDALKSVMLPTVEVHISKVSEREDFRQVSYVGLYAEKTITGRGIDGYNDAVDYLSERYNK